MLSPRKTGVVGGFQCAFLSLRSLGFRPFPLGGPPGAPSQFIPTRQLPASLWSKTPRALFSGLVAAPPLPWMATSKSTKALQNPVPSDAMAVLPTNVLEGCAIQKPAGDGNRPKLTSTKSLWSSARSEGIFLV